MSYPEQSFTGSANNVTVNVYAPAGVFPEGTTMSVTGVSNETAMSIAGVAADSGTEVVDAIGAVETGEEDKPLEEVLVNSVTISTYSAEEESRLDSEAASSAQ